MNEQTDFNEFVECVLVIAADKQSGAEIIWVDITEACVEVNPSCPPTWISSAADWLDNQGLGRVLGDNEDPERSWFFPNSRAISYAASVRKRRRPPTITDTLASDKVQKVGSLGISLLSFLVSIGALIVAIIALNKVG